MKPSNKILEIIRLTHTPCNPCAGDSFVVVVELNRTVDEADGEVIVLLDKQRLVLDAHGCPVTRPTGQNYFREGFEPRPIVVSNGSKFGVSSPVIVRKDASFDEEEFPVKFPENLLLIGKLEDSFCSDLVLVQGAEEIFRLAGTPFRADDLTVGQKVPNTSEIAAVGAFTAKIIRGTSEFNALVDNVNSDIEYKDEEASGADRMMTSELQSKVNALAQSVKEEWPTLKLRITEAWDENNEHGTNSLHYEARAVDLTTFPIDGAKLGRLGRLAVDAGFGWVYYENNLHIHASVQKA